VYDSCGMAGGSPTWTGTQLSFIDTVNAKQGDKGSQVLAKSTFSHILSFCGFYVTVVHSNVSIHICVFHVLTV
jgi:hypothetical protein